MRQIQTNTQELVNPSTEAQLSEELVSAHNTMVSHVAYNEMLDFPVQPVDLLQEVGSNLQHLLELQSRLRFMTREVRYLLKV